MKMKFRVILITNIIKLYNEQTERWNSSVNILFIWEQRAANSKPEYSTAI